MEMGWDISRARTQDSAACFTPVSCPQTISSGMLLSRRVFWTVDGYVVAQLLIEW